MIKNAHTLSRVAARTGLAFDKTHHFCTSTDAEQDAAQDLLERLGYRLVYRELAGLGPRPVLWPRHG